MLSCDMDASGSGEDTDMDGGGGGVGTQTGSMAPHHSGDYTQYNIYGNSFEVSSKYCQPIRPIGRGAYGIVWSVLTPL
jgi:hypothetical protein